VDKDRVFLEITEHIYTILIYSNNTL